MTDQVTKAASAAASLSLAALVARAERAGTKAPPVENWNPDFCGDIDMVIRGDASWWYQGTPIARPALVRLFSSVLRKDGDGRTFLVTPVEKLGITVEDAPFLAVEMSRGMREGEPVITFRTNVGDVVEAGPDHPIHFAGTAGSRDEEGTGFCPYVTVRGRLEAKLTRALAFDLADWIEEAPADGDPGGKPATRYLLRSNGAAFDIPSYQHEA